MTHRYFDYYFLLPSAEQAEKARNYYVETYKSKIGGEFEIYKNGVCSLSLRDECEVIMDFYRFGMTRFVVADTDHGLKLEHGKQLYEFCTDTDVLYTYKYRKGLLDDIKKFLEEKIHKDGINFDGSKQPPIVARHASELNYDDIYDMLNVDVPGLDY